MLPETYEDGGFWVIIAVILAIVFSFAAFALALAGSRLAKRSSIAAMVLAVLVSAAPVLVALDVLPTGDREQTEEVRDWQRIERERHESPQERARWQHERLVRALQLGATWAAAPLLLGALALGVWHLRRRAAVTSSR